MMTFFAGTFDRRCVSYSSQCMGSTNLGVWLIDKTLNVLIVVLDDSRLNICLPVFAFCAGLSSAERRTGRERGVCPCHGDVHQPGAHCGHVCRGP